MKVTAHDVARSLLHTCRSLPAGEQEAAADAALHLLRTHGLSKQVRTFPRLVRTLLQKEEGILFAQLVTPDGTAAATNEAIVSALEKRFGRKVHLTHGSDPSLLGGAQLSVGDERYDASVRGALARLQRSLTVAAA